MSSTGALKRGERACKQADRIDDVDERARVGEKRRRCNEERDAQREESPVAAPCALMPNDPINAMVPRLRWRRRLQKREKS